MIYIGKTSGCRSIRCSCLQKSARKNKEATDLDNVRSAYANVMAAAITDEEAEPIGFFEF